MDACAGVWVVSLVRSHVCACACASEATLEGVGQAVEQQNGGTPAVKEEESTVRYLSSMWHQALTRGGAKSNPCLAGSFFLSGGHLGEAALGRDERRWLTDARA